jgi:hypothetical protein
MVISSAPSTPTSPLSICPRCDSDLVTSYHEPECLLCGFVDYFYTPVKRIGIKSVVSDGARYVLRYVGDFPSLADTLANVRLERLRNRVVYGVQCPFCGGPMDQSSLSGKRREVREERYKCGSGHRISLLPKKDGSLGWK